MKSEDMKIKKYEMLIQDINKYFNRYRCNREPEYSWFDTNEISLLDYFIDDNERSVWLKAIFEASSLLYNYSVGAGCPYNLDFSKIVKDDTMSCINNLRKCNHCYLSGGRPYYPSWLLFWLIFIVSVDNENYNNNLSVVADVAYLLEFSEEELADWITAVKGVLAGKKLSELEYKTEKGYGWFKN